MDKKFIIFILVLGGILLLLGSWFWWSNTYSREVLKLEILGPSEVEAGNEVNYIVRYKNNGNTRLENPRLVFEYPENAIMSEELRESENDNMVLRGEGKVEISLEDIQPGEERTQEFKGIVFGREDSTVTAKVWIYYNPRNLNVEYHSETTNTIRITSVPFTFEIHLPNRAEPGNQFNFDINYFSRIDYPISNLRVKIDYPSEFEFSSSRPRPSFDDSEWEIGVLNRGQGGRIEVTGVLRGEPSTAKIFRASLGFWKDGQFILLKESTRGIEVATPLILISHQVNGRSQYSAASGEYLYYELFFKNTGEDVLENLFLTARLNQEIVDIKNVQPGTGKFQENSGMIVWDSSSVSQLRFLPVMEEGKVDFWIKLKENINISDPAVRIELSLGNVRERITTKIISRVALIQRGYSSQGPFSNYGPQPPTVGSSTSYTIHWSVSNHNNDLGDAKVRAVLPQGVRLTGEVLPDETKIFFDPESREVVWDIGYLPAQGDNFRETHFQLVFDPQFNQKGDVARIISEAVFSARDNWTNSTVRTEYRAIDTNLPDDSGVSGGIIQ